jgi:SulP family sulfate permease
LLISLVVMSALSALCDLPAKGVAVVGAIPAELPSFVAPHVEGGAAGKLIVGAAAIAALGLLEAVAMARTIAARTGQPLDVRQQCRSEGLANLAGSFFQCIPGSGSLTRSSINYHVGALTQWSGVFAALAVGAAVLLFAPLAGSIPCAALAGILMVTAWRLIDHVRLIAQFRSRPGRAALVLALAGAAIVISIEWSILVGIALSLLVSAFTNQHVHSRTPAPAAHRPPAKCVDAL